MRILIVDDDELNRRVLSAMLSMDGVDIVQTENAALALRFIDEMDFSAVLMDLRMPGMDGFEATRIIRRSEGRQKDVPLAIVTADMSLDLEEACADAGADELIRKPVRLDQLHDTLGRMLIKPRAFAPDDGRRGAA